MQNQNNYKCHCCGAELTEDNCREVNSAFSQNGLSPYCIECEAEYYSRLAAVEGNSLALFHTCAAFNVPCKPIVLDGAKFGRTDNRWLVYTSRLAETGEDMKGNDIATFFDGETDMLKVFGKNFTERDFAEYIKHERASIEKQVGTKQQREKWGTLPLYKDLPMTAAIYEELDRLYGIRAATFKGQTLTPQQDNTLMQVAKDTVIKDHLMRQGLVKSATEITKSIDMQLASEEMRRKDIKPEEQVRLDALTDYLEKDGLMEKGELLSYDELVEVLRDKHAKSKKYNYSLDVGDQIILDVLNAIRANSDQLLLSTLPEEYMLEDEYGEFEKEETEKEKEEKKFANLTKII